MIDKSKREIEKSRPTTVIVEEATGQGEKRSIGTWAVVPAFDLTQNTETSILSKIHSAF